MLCQCTSNLPYHQCCGVYHAGLPAPTAALLMRSRYCAYVLGLDDYLRLTWDTSTVPADLSPNPLVSWKGLTIKPALSVVSQNPNEDWVEFIATYQLPKQPLEQLHEISRFVRKTDLQQVMRWYYVDGVFPEG